MKEWLLETEDGKYHYYRDDMDCCPKYVEKIEIPEGAEISIKFNIDKANHGICFYQSAGRLAWSQKDPYWKDSEWSKDNLLDESYKHGNIDLSHKVLWQREDFFIDESEIVSEEMKSLSSEKHSHYFKDVSNLLEIDVYRVLKLFDVTDPCIQHAVKKLLCAGGRGVKDVDKDVHEAIDSLLRYEEMRKEDETDS
ncbi:hypothetical protein [Acinetobacter phage vB_AbaM_BP10]|nr:hypothetical protein [Acinetobacter phage vB_AbaM_BP10]